MLMDKVMQICTRKQMSTLWLEVRASNNIALNLYISYGFTEQERRKNYYNSAAGKEDAVIMKYQIAPG
jgi:ribosomal-protein-alanine N-acetyltransferase